MAELPKEKTDGMLGRVIFRARKNEFLASQRR
jgi:hypothetical protein